MVGMCGTLAIGRYRAVRMRDQVHSPPILHLHNLTLGNRYIIDIRQKRRSAVALSKHWARPCAQCLRSRGAFLAPTVLRRGFATMTLRWVPPQLSGASRQCGPNLWAIALLSLARRGRCVRYRSSGRRLAQTTAPPIEGAECHPVAGAELCARYTTVGKRLHQRTPLAGTASAWFVAGGRC